MILPSVFDAVPLAPNQFHDAYVCPLSFTAPLSPLVKPSESKEVKSAVEVLSASVLLDESFIVAPLIASNKAWLDVELRSLIQTQSG